MNDFEFSSKTLNPFVKPASPPKESREVKGGRAIKFHDKHYYDSSAFTTLATPYSAVTFYNAAHFLIG